MLCRYFAIASVEYYSAPCLYKRGIDAHLKLKILQYLIKTAEKTQNSELFYWVNCKNSADYEIFE